MEELLVVGYIMGGSNQDLNFEPQMGSDGFHYTCKFEMFHELLGVNDTEQIFFTHLLVITAHQILAYEVLWLLCNGRPGLQADNVMLPMQIHSGCYRQWVPLNSASKYIEELDPIKRDAQLSRGRIK